MYWCLDSILPKGNLGETVQLIISLKKRKKEIVTSNYMYASSPELVVFSDANATSEEFSEGMLWIEDSGISVSVLVSQVDSVSLVQLSMYRGSKASVLEPPQPMMLTRMGDTPEELTSDT